MRNKRTKIGILTALFLLTAGLGTANSAPVSPEAVKLEELEMEPWTESLNALEEAVQTLDGFGSIALRDSSTAVLHVKEGSAAAAVNLPQYEALSVEKVFVPFSLDELIQERDRLTAEAIKADSPISEIIPDTAGGAIELTVTVPEREEHRRSGESSLERLGLSPSVIPLKLSYVEVSPQVTSRLDTNPTGAQIIHEGGQRIRSAMECTSGVPVFDTKLLRQSVLTAGHCGSNGEVFRDGTNKTYGTMYGDLMTLNPGPASYDYALLQNVAGAINVGSIARGPVYSQSGSYPSGSFNAIPGSPRLCGSGSFSGEVCDLGVLSTNMNVNYPEHGWAYGVTKLRSYGAHAGWGVGDSGGPVFMANGNGTVTIAGIMSGEAGASPAKPCKEGTNRTCRTDLYLAPFNFIRDVAGLVISQGM